ncbi:squalene synthase HpnC [bacterium]|nr:squalene synthase HpnC [bacterium]NUN44534.1 squalene synthase HpnC [bacterium]
MNEERAIGSYSDDEIDAAYAMCRDFAASHYENFPVISWIFNAAQRRHLAAVYTFLRRADDVADEGTGTIEQRMHGLLWMQAALKASEEGRAKDPMFAALSVTLQKGGIPRQWLDDVLSAFKVDLLKNRYTDEEQLMGYCRYSANPVGLIVLHILGYTHNSTMWEKMTPLSDAICSALQLTNHWQDVFIDLQKNRLYIPLELMKECGYTEEDWKNKTVNTSFSKTMAVCLKKTRDLFDQGHALLGYLRFKDRKIIGMIWLSGLRVLMKMEKTGGDTLNHRPTIGLKDKFWILWRVLWI